MRTTTTLITLLFVLGLFASACVGTRGRGGGGGGDDDDASGDDDDGGWDPLPVLEQYSDCEVDVERDVLGDGSTVWDGYEQRNGDGYWTLLEWYTDEDSTVDWQETADRGPGNHLLESEAVSPSGLYDGGVTTYEYDDEGHLIRWENDVAADGTTDEINEYVWDGDDRIEYRRDDDGDGSWDIAYFYTYSGGDAVSVSLDSGADGSIDFVGAIEVNSAGQWERIDWEDSEGEPVATATWDFSDPEYWELYRFDDGANGTWELQEMREFDSQWRLVGSQTDEGEGWADIYEYNYECP